MFRNSPSNAWWAATTLYLWIDSSLTVRARTKAVSGTWANPVATRRRQVPEHVLDELGVLVGLNHHLRLVAALEDRVRGTRLGGFDRVDEVVDFDLNVVGQVEHRAGCGSAGCG